MKSRTDFVSIGWMDQLRQAMYNQIKAMGVLLWVLLGFTVGLGNMMMEISPFGAALCAAAPFRYLPAAALGSAAGSLLLSNLAELGGAHTLTIKYTAAILLITLARRTAAHSESTMQRTTAAPLLAFFGLLLPSVASLLAQSFSGYKLVMALAEATMAAACAYFLARGLKAFSLGQGLFTLTRADFISVVLTASMLIVSLSNVTFGGISLGRLLAALAVLLCALAGGERWGAISGIVCGTAVGVALFPKMQLIGIYALAGLAAGVFSNLGRFAVRELLCSPLGDEPSFRSAAGDAAGVRRVHQCGDVAVAAAERFVCAAGKAVPPTDGQRGEKRAPADAGAAGRGKRCAAGDRAHHSGGLSPAGQGQSRQPGAGV